MEVWRGGSVRIAASHLMSVVVDRAVQHPSRTSQNLKHGGFKGSTQSQATRRISADHPRQLSSTPNVSPHFTPLALSIRGCTLHLRSPPLFLTPRHLIHSSHRDHLNRAIELIPDPRSQPANSKEIFRCRIPAHRHATRMQRCAGS